MSIFKKLSFGFTLIEILIVFGVLATLLSIVIIAVNPIDQLNKASDISAQSTIKDFSNSVNYYFAASKTQPWVKDANCRKELADGKTLADIPTCVKTLTESSQVATQSTSHAEAKNIYVTECGGAIATCYKPNSSAFNKSAEVKYTKNGVLDPTCADKTNGNKDCYACTFSTNTAQECFQALNPNGNLAIVPNPSPSAPLPVGEKNSVDACSDASAGKAKCMAAVVADSTDTPLSSLGLPGGFGPDQLHSAYNLPCAPGGIVSSKCIQPASFGTKIIGIAIAYHDPTLESDLAVYTQKYGIPSCTIANGCLIVVNQNGQVSPLPSVNPTWALEESLDVQMSHAICQTCKILVVEANSNTFADLGIAVNRAAQMGANSISNSYGAAEWSGSTAFDSYYTHSGVFVTASSGDWGYGSYYPASSKNVIAIGGTTLSLLADNSYSSESVWSGTGSGCAGYQTAYGYQTGAPNWNLTNCGTKRGINDVSADANPSTGVAIYDSTYSGQSAWWIVGGTSLSSPVVAAALAMNANAPSSGDASSYIYSNLNKFRDVTVGSNGSCGGSTICTAATGYDGPTGVGTPNFLSFGVSNIVTPTSSPSSTLTPTPSTPTINCGLAQTVTLATSTPILALPGDTVNNTLSIKNNSSSECGITLYTISRGAPSGWTVSGVPASVTVAGGATANVYFTIQVPANATAGNYGYQFWVARPGETSPNPVNGSIQVAQVGPTNTPTPTPINCFHAWSNSLGSTSMSGNAGDTLNQTLTITNNNPASCGSALFAISYAYPSGWLINGLQPPSVSVAGGQTVTLPITIGISTGAQIQDYTTQFWVNSGNNPLNATIHVLGTATPPEEQMFSNFGGKSYGNYATFEFSYNAQGAVSSRLDVSTDPNGLNTTAAPAPAGTRYGFGFTSGYAWESTNNPSPSAVRGFIISSPQSWSGWQCGATIYYRMYNSGDLRIKSPVKSTVVDCNTSVNVLPWDPWYAAIYQGVYDSRYDVDNNGVINYIDYWNLVRATRLR